MERVSWEAGMVVGLGVWAGACVHSVEPVVRPEDERFEAGLVGTWEEVDGSDRILVSPAAKGQGYTIEYWSDGERTLWQGSLGRLEGRLVLDVRPAPGKGEVPDAYADVLLPLHVLFVVEMETNQVRLALLDPDSMDSALRAASVGLARSAADDVVLLSSSADLRRELASYLSRPGALEDAGVFRRTLAGALRPRQAVEPPCFEAASWREADGLFRGDRRWLGADVASTVDLSGGRTLWLFGDTWGDPTARGTREGARMVSNSVAIQSGYDPSTASITFHWGAAADGSADALFPDRDGESLWFGNGVRVEDRLVLFFARTIRNTGTGLGFVHVGWTVVIQDGYVVALGSQNPVKSHPLFAARWPAERVRAGDLRDPEWWAGERVGWVPDSSSVQRWPLFENGGSEMSVHMDAGTGAFIQVQTAGFGPADLVMRAVPALTGPWSKPRMFFRPPEYHRPAVMIYAGKAHPHLQGADLVVTYATNTFESSDYFSDPSLYYPRFVRLTRCR